MKLAAVKLLFSFFSLSFMWFKSSFTSNCCSTLPELSRLRGHSNHSLAFSTLCDLFSLFRAAKLWILSIKQV